MLDMRTIVETTFDIGQELYMLTINRDDVVKVKVHYIKAEWHPYGSGIFYSLYPVEDGKYIRRGDYIQEITEKFLFLTEAEARARMK